MATRASRSRTSLTAADIAAASRAYPILGFVISWYARGVQIDYGDLETLLELAGFSAYIPSKPTNRNALRRGIENWLKARGAVRGGADSVSTEDDEDGAETSSRGGRANGASCARNAPRTLRCARRWPNSPTRASAAPARRRSGRWCCNATCQR